MTNLTLAVGTKVVAVAKTTKGYEGVENCRHYRIAKDRKQPFLYVVGYDTLETTGEKAYLLNSNPHNVSGPHGSYYHHSDLLVYKEGKAQVGDTIVFTGFEGQTDNYNVGETYTVTDIDRISMAGNGVNVEGKSIFVLRHENYVVVTKPAPLEKPIVPPVKPAKLDLRGLLFAMHNNDTIVSVDCYDDITDHYTNFSDLEDKLAIFEIEDEDFYLEETFNEYLLAVADYEKAVKEQKERQAQAEKVENEVNLEGALKALLNGKSVEVVLDDETTDVFDSVCDMERLTTLEQEHGRFFVQ